MYLQSIAGSGTNQFESVSAVSARHHYLQLFVLIMEFSYVMLTLEVHVDTALMLDFSVVRLIIRHYNVISGRAY